MITVIDVQDNKRDLLLNVISNPDKNFEDLVNAGFTIDNIELHSKSVYQNDSEIQQTFTKNGQFDQELFDKVYATVSNYKDNLQHIKDYKKQIDFFEYHRDNFLADENKRRKGPDFTIFRAPNPFEQTSGIVQLGKLENPTKTAQEIAQGEQVHNLKTDTWEESPEEASLFGNIFSEAKVLAVYEEDGVHEDPITGELVQHKVGDLKFNANGKPYYETLNGRDVYGRQVLSNFDVLTKEDSDWNRYDFFDNDGYDKSVVGSLAKTVAVVAPMFIPYVGPVYTGASVLVNAMGLFGTLGKIANANDWMDPETSKWFNNLEGWSKSMNTLDSRSEYAKQHMWSIENMIGLAGDVITQLKEQRWIFQYGPAFFDPSWNVAKALTAKKGVDLDKLTAIFQKKLQGKKFAELLTNVNNRAKNPIMDAATIIQSEAKRQAENYFGKSQKISEVLSKLYMTGITTQDGYSEAKAAGADDVTAALYALAYAGGEYAIINSNIGEWILPEKKIGAELNRKTLNTLFSSLMKSKPAATASKAEKLGWFQNVVQGAKKKLSSDYIVGAKNQSQTIMDNMLAGALAEGVEEVTEEIWTDLSRSIYNTVQYFRGEEDTYMSAWDNVLDRYLMSAVGGALGGGVTALDLDVVKNLNKDMTFNEAAQRVITMARNNPKNHEFDNLLKTASKMNFGTVELENGKTGNQIVQQSLQQFANFVNQVITAENANLTDDHILNKVSKELREDFKWSQLMSPFYKEEVGEDGKTKLTPIENSIIGAKILQDINSDIAVILGDAASNHLAETSKTDSQERKEEKENKEAPKKKEEEKSKDPSKVDKARKHLQDTLSGALNYEYAQLFLYEYTHMGDRLIPATFRAFVKMKTGKHLEEFNEEQKKDLKEEYDATKKNRADLLMFLANAHQQISELSKETVEKNSNIYEENAKNEKLQHLTKFLEKLVTFDAANVTDDVFLENFAQLYNNLEAWTAQVYTAEGEKVLDENGNQQTRTLGLYTALNSAFGEEEDWKEGVTLFKVDPITENDSPELQEKKKQLLDYNDQFAKYKHFIQSIKQLGRLVEFYEKQGFINSELKQTLYHLTDQLNKSRTKIELLSNRYSDILKNISKQYFTLEESEENFYTFINSLFPGKTFNSVDEFNTYITTEAKDAEIGKLILGLMSEGLELSNDSDLSEAFQILTTNLSGFDGVLNYDKIEQRDYVDKALLGFNESQDGTTREEIYNQQLDQINQLQTELQEALNLTEQTRTKLNSLAHTQIEEDLNKFAVSIGEEAIFTNLMESLNKYLFQNRNSIDSIMLNDTLDKYIEDALWIIDMYADTLTTARTVLYDATNVWGYNKTLNSIAKKVKTDKELPALAEIDSATVDVFLQDLNLYKKKLKFLKKLYAVNAGQKFAVNDRVELNTSYIFLSKLKQWIGSFEPKDGFEGVKELNEAIEELTMVDKFYNKGEKNFSLTQDDKVLMTKERIKAEVALYEFFNKNLKNMTYEKFKKLLVPKDFTISDLFKSRPTIINEKTEDVSFLEFINYLATRAAINANSLRYEVAGVIQDELKSDSTNKIVPIPTQVEAVFYPYAKFANPQVVQKFTYFKRKLLEESVKNITKEQLIELTNLGLSPFSKGSITDENAEEAITKFKDNFQSLLAYPEFEDVITLVEGMPGTGKSYGVDDLIAKMIRKYHKEYLKDAIVINTTSETAEKLAKALKLENSYTIEEFLTQTMQNHKEVEINAEGNLVAKEGVHYKVINESQIDAMAEPKEGLKLPSIIFVDELPTLNRIQILELAKLARKYNIEILATGDYNQTTPSGKIEFKKEGSTEVNSRSLKVSRSKYFPSTKLGVSMRTDNNQKTNNINQAQVAVDTAQYEPDEDVDLTLTYMEDENGIFGDKVVFAQNEDITDEQLSQILKDVDLMIKTLKKDKKGDVQKINYIFSNPNSKLYKKLSQDNKYKNYIQFHAGNTSQGKEGQYWIVENNRNVSSLSTYMQELYTGISRSEQGSIIIASSNYSGNLAKLTLKNTRTTVRINEGFSEDIKKQQLEKLIKFYGALKLDETPVEVVRNKPVNQKNPLVEELRKAEQDASLTGEPVYYTIKQEDPLIIKVGDEEISITKEDLINKIKTENYRLKEGPVVDDSDPNILEQEVVDDASNRRQTDALNEKQKQSEKRIDSQNESEVINYYRYLYSAFSMETSVEVDDSGNLIIDPSTKLLSTDPNDKRIDNIIGLYKYFNGNKGYYELHEKLNKLRLVFLTIDNQNTLYNRLYDILEIPKEKRKDLYFTFGYKKTNATLKSSGNREEQVVYGKANKTSKETIEYNAQGGERSNEVGVNNLVVNIGYDETGDFLEIPLMRFASPISIMYQTDKNGQYLFPDLIYAWKSSKETTTWGKMRDLINQFGKNKKYEYIINEFKFYTLPNSNYFSISALDSDWLPARNLQNLGPQIVTNAGIEFYNETGFEFSNDDENSWQPISAFREVYREIMQVSRIKMFTSNIIKGVDVSNHVDIGFPFVLTKLGESSNNLEETDEFLMNEFLDDIKNGRDSKIRVVYLSKPKIKLDSYLKKLYNFIFNKDEKTEFGNILTTFKILDALFSNFDENVEKGLINKNSVRTKVVKQLLEKVQGIKNDKSEPYTKEEIEQIVSILKDTFDSEGYGRNAEIAFEGSEISVKTLFDSYVANLINNETESGKIDENKLNLLVQQVVSINNSLESIYADGIKFSNVDGIVTLEDSYLLRGEKDELNPEEFFIHAKVTLPMFFNSGLDFVQKFMNQDSSKGEVFIVNGKTQYSKHNYNYFGVKWDKNKKEVVPNSKYKYGKSKIDSKNNPGEKEKTVTVEDLLNDIQMCFDKFNSSKKTVADAKTLFGKVYTTARDLKVMDSTFDFNTTINNLTSTILNNGIYIMHDSTGFYFYNLKTKDYQKTYGEFQSVSYDETSNQAIITFKLGDKLYDYVVQDATDTKLTLMNITPEQEVNETEGQSSEATEGVEQGLTEEQIKQQQEQEKLQNYVEDFDSIFRDEEFMDLLSNNKILTNLFNKIKHTDLNTSLYERLSKLPIPVRNTVLNTLKKELNNATLTDTLKQKIILLDNFITPPSC